MLKVIGYYAGIFSAAVVLGLAGTEIARRIALRLEIFDRPEKRKIHAEPVPYLGGLGMYLAFLIYGLIGEWVFPHLVRNYQFPTWFGPAMISATLLVAFGIWDDIKGLSAWMKFPIQVLAMLVIALMSDLQIAKIAHPFGGFIEFGPFTIVATVVWGVMLINAINLIDGLDGLAAGVVAISCAFLFIHNIIMGSTSLMLLGLIGICLGFLRYNFAPARIFMGDAGSMFLGFLLAVFSMQVRVKGTMIVTLIFPLLALGIPILDTSFAFLRRLSQGKHPFQGDARHIHHRFLALGLTSRQVVLVIYFFCIAFGLFALVMTRLTPAYRLLTIGLLILLISFFIMALQHLEKQFLKALEEVKAYKSWYEYHFFEGDHQEAGACEAGESGPANPPEHQDQARRSYAPPVIARSLMERLIRSEEQRTENILILAGPEWSQRLADMARHLGHRAACAAALTEVEKIVDEGGIGAVIIEESVAGPKLPSLLMKARLTNPKATILILTSNTESPQTIELLRLGVHTFLPACASDQALEILIQNAMESRFAARRLDLLNILFWLLIFSIPLWVVIGRFITLGKFY